MNYLLIGSSACFVWEIVYGQLLVSLLLLRLLRHAAAHVSLASLGWLGVGAVAFVKLKIVFRCHPDENWRLSNAPAPCCLSLSAAPLSWCWVWCWFGCDGLPQVEAAAEAIVCVFVFYHCLL